MARLSSSRGNLLPRRRSRRHHAPRRRRSGRAPAAAGRRALRAAARSSPARIASSTSYASSIRYGRSDSCVCAASHSQRARRSRISASVSSSLAFLAWSPRGPYLLQSSHDSESRRPMTRAWVEIDLGALCRNGAAVAARAGVPLLPMVKADATASARCASRSRSRRSSRGATASRRSPKATSCGAAGITRPIVVFTPILAQRDRRAAPRPISPPRSATRGRSSVGAHGASLASRDRHGDVARRNAGGTTWASIASSSSAPRPDGRVHALPLRRAGRREPRRSRSSASPRARRAARAARARARRERPRGRASRAVAVEPRATRHLPLRRRAASSRAPLVPEPVVSVRARIVELRTIDDGETVSYDAHLARDGPAPDRDGRLSAMPTDIGAA